MSRTITATLAAPVDAVLVGKPGPDLRPMLRFFDQISYKAEDVAMFAAQKQPRGPVTPNPMQQTFDFQ